MIHLSLLSLQFNTGQQEGYLIEMTVYGADGLLKQMIILYIMLEIQDIQMILWKQKKGWGRLNMPSYQ